MVDKEELLKGVPIRFARLRNVAEYLRNDSAYAPALKEIELLESRHTKLTDALKAALESTLNMAAQLDTWAQQSRDGGWSTHQVEPMRAKADVLRREAETIRAALNPKG